MSRRLVAEEVNRRLNGTSVVVHSADDSIRPLALRMFHHEGTLYSREFLFVKSKHESKRRHQGQSP